jgi:hypothetical protein
MHLSFIFPGFLKRIIIKNISHFAIGENTNRGDPPLSRSCLRDFHRQLFAL